MAVQVPTSPNVCFYTTWGKHNKRNMHWNEQQTSTNWRLDRIKIWWRQSELMKYIVYLLIALLPAIKRLTGDTFDTVVFQQYSAPVHRLAKRSNCWSVKPQASSLRISGPIPQQPWPQSGRLQALGRHATAGLSDDVQECGWTQEAIGWNPDWSGACKNIIDNAINEWRKRLCACIRAKGRHSEHLL